MMAPHIEALERRQLLSFLQPFGAKFTRVQSGGVVDVISVAGPGQVFTKRINRKLIAISLAGTTQDSQVTISSLGAGLAGANRPLQIGKIVVRSGRLGSFQGLTTADLDGPMTPLTGPVTSLQFDAIGPGAQISISGNLGQLSVNRGIDLATAGHINVSNDLTGSLSITRDLTLAGGQINIGQDLTGTVSIGGNLSESNGSQFSVGRNLGSAASTTGSSAGSVAVAGNLAIDSDSKLSVGGNLIALTVGGNFEASGNGEISVTGNLGSLTVSGGGGASATGNVTLSSGGELLVGQNLDSLSVGSNIATSTGGTIHVVGNLGSLSAANIEESTTGAIVISTNLTGSLSVTGAVALNGGQISVGQDLSGSVAIGSGLTLTNSGQFTVGRNLGATATGAAADTITGNLSVDSDSKFSVGGNLSALTVGGNLEASGAGQIAVTGNLNSLTVSGGGGASPTGNVTLSSGGELLVGQNLSSLSVGSNIATSTGGTIHVAGDLGTLSVAGDVQGKGSNDILVGDDLGQLTVLGGASGGSLQDVDISVAKNIQGLDIRNGIFHSLITAGILIDGGTPGTGSNGWNIGPDGTFAVFDSQILAGSKIRNITIGGDVKSDLPSNSAGSPTRIVAGEYPEGTYLPGGTIDKFQITGQLIDSVLAASVEPSNGFYPQPAGTIQVGFTPTPPAPPTTIPDYTAPPFEDSSVPANLVLPGGSINPSFTPAPLSPTTTPGTAVPIPSTSTVLGGVVTSPHANNADFAGIFAADTRGVIVGPLPPILPPNG